MKQAIIWSQPDCRYCEMAKKYLVSQGYSYVEKVIGHDRAYSKKDLLAVVPNAKTVPQIFINGEYIGGYEELVKAI
jgi:glutaredoxin